jgi:hypothetical protein
MKPERLEPANRVLACFAEETRLEIRNHRIWVVWQSYGGKTMERQWLITRGNSFYPPWHNKWGHGGTATTAMSQLIRWVQDKPVLPMSSWHHWTSERVLLGRDRGPEMIRLLTEGGYPQHVPCVLCGNQIVGGLDWWSLDGVSGPCCHWSSGCRQKRAVG